MKNEKLVEKIKKLRTLLNISTKEIANKLDMCEENYKAFEDDNYLLSDLKCLKCLNILSMDEIYNKYVNCIEENGNLKDIEFIHDEYFNFGNVVDLLSLTKPNKLALLHIDSNNIERRFTYSDMSKLSNMTANYLTNLGVKKGDKVMLVLKSKYQFWYILLALHKIGAVVVPATHMLKEHDYKYRIDSANIKTIISDANSDIINEIESACSSKNITKISVDGNVKGWYNFDDEFTKYSSDFKVEKTNSKDPMVIFFTSGTTSNPKAVVQTFDYPLTHVVTAKYWQNVKQNGLHYTMADTGWAKFFWGKIYGQWLCDAPVFAYDYEGKYNPSLIASMIEKYNITTLCAPSTNYRMFNTIDLKNYNLDCVSDFVVAGELLDKNSYDKFSNRVGKNIRNGYGFTEGGLIFGQFRNNLNNSSSLGTLNPMYEAVIVDSKGNNTNNGELLVKLKRNNNPGLLEGYLCDGIVKSPLIDSYYHTSDIIKKEENKYYFISRKDDIIKTSGYKVSPPEVEEIIMELPFVKECMVVGVPDTVRGQVVKALIVLKNEELKNELLINEIQKYVKNKTAPYKYPRLVEFLNKLPKTVSGKTDRGKVKKLVSIN